MDDHIFCGKADLTALEYSAYETASRMNMFFKGQNVVVGVSGGADSVTLLHLLRCSMAFAPLELNLTVCHINHNLRGKESDRDENFVRKLCSTLGVPFRLLSIDAAALARESGRSVEDRSREERYRFFHETALALPNAIIATAHTLDDSLETFFINLARGTGSAGLAGIPPVRDGIVRPLISCTRQQIEEYCSTYQLDFITDSTNLSDDYTRNRVRHNVIPALRSALSGVDGGFARMSRLVRADAEYIDLQADDLIKKSFSDGGYNISMLRHAHEAVRGRALMQLLSQNGAEISEKKVSELEKVLNGETNACEPLKNTYFKHCGELLVIEHRSTPEPYFEYRVAFGDVSKETVFRINSHFCAKIYRIDQEHYKNLKKVNPLLYYNCIDYDKINSSVLFRQRIPGDSIRIGGMTRTLKKLFNGKCIPVSLRDSLPCAADDDGLFWIYGIGCADRAAVSENSKNIGVFEIWEETENGNGK